MGCHHDAFCDWRPIEPRELPKYCWDKPVDFTGMIKPRVPTEREKSLARLEAARAQCTGCDKANRIARPDCPVHGDMAEGGK